MSDEITEAIEKLKLYRQQIKEQAKKEILDFVKSQGDDYFSCSKEKTELLELYKQQIEWPSKSLLLLNNQASIVDSEVMRINKRLNSLQDVQNMITFLKLNYAREFKEMESWDCESDRKLIG